MATLWKLFHVLTAFWLVAGLIGRTVTMARAEKSGDIGIAKALVETAGRFEKLMVIPGSMAVLVLGLITAFAQGLNFTAPGNGWLLWSLVIFATNMALVPTLSSSLEANVSMPPWWLLWSLERLPPSSKQSSPTR